MPTPPEVTARVIAAYGAAADHYDDPANQFWNRFGRATVKLLEISPGARVLDLCCGAGASAIPAAEAAGPTGQVIGVDLSEDLLALARRKAADRRLGHLSFVAGDILADDFDPGPCDCVICVFGIFFIPDMAGALRSMWRFVRPGGRLALTTWGRGVFEPANTLYWDAVRGVRPDLHKAFNPWDRVSDPESLRALFGEAGLPEPRLTQESARHPLASERDVKALILGTGYRGTFDQLTEAQKLQVLSAVIEGLRRQGTAEVRVDVIFAVCSRDAT